jgi:5'-nucleotidase
MHILITNDDGVMALGLLALVQELRGLAEISVLAPDRNWSASGHVKTLHRPLRVRETFLTDGTPALSSDGSPSDCVALGMMGILPKPVDLVVSGINTNANIGHDVTYSGTVTAAMEAAIGGVPGVAVSLDLNRKNHPPIDYGPAARVTRRVVQSLSEHGLPAHSLLNVNVPYLPDEQIRGYQITRQGLRIYRDELVRREDPRGRPYYWIGGDAPTGVPEDGTDFGAITAGYVSITPLQLDLTAYAWIDPLRTWDWGGQPVKGPEDHSA